MNGVIKKIKNIFPVTTSKAVYLDGTNETLQEAIDNGTFTGTVASTNANFITASFPYTGEMIIILNSDKSITIDINKGKTYYQCYDIYYSNGSKSRLSMLDSFPITIRDGESLTYDDTNKLQVQTGLPSVPYNKIVLAYNNYGKIVYGTLKSLFDQKYQGCNILKTYNVKMDEFDSKSSLHSMFLIGDELITLECTDPGNFSGLCNVYDANDLSYKKSFNCDFHETNSKGELYYLRLVCCDYNNNINALLMGNSTNNGKEDGMGAYIFYEANTWKDKTDTVSIENCGKYTHLDFSEEGVFASEEFEAKPIWSELDDIIYLTTTNMHYIHKILLGKGTNKLEHGVYDSDNYKKYNGTYKIIKTYYQPEIPEGDGGKDKQYYNGCIYNPIKYVKGGYRIIKTLLNIDGTISNERIVYEPINEDGTQALTGSPEGFVIYNNKIICSHASYTKFYCCDVI